MFELRYLAGHPSGMNFAGSPLEESVTIRTLEKISTFYTRDGEVTRKRAAELFHSKEYAVQRPSVKAFWLWLIYLQEKDTFGLVLESPTMFKPSPISLEKGRWFVVKNYVLKAGGHEWGSLMYEQAPIDRGVNVPQEVVEAWNAKVLSTNS